MNTVEVAAAPAGNEYAVKGDGLTGKIDIVVTMNDDGTIAKVDVKGTDSAMDTSFVGMCQNDAFLGQFVGKTIPVEGIDTVAGATVSSNGIIAAVNTVEVAAAPAVEEPAAEVTGTEYRASADGFTGLVTVAVIVAEDGTIGKVSIKGTDSEYDEAFVAKCDTDAFLGQFVGKTIPVEGIDIVAGATASSNAIINAVNSVVIAAEEPAVEGTEYAVQGDGLTGKIDVVVIVAEDGTIAKVDVKGTDSDMDASFVAKCQDEAFLSQFVGKTIPVEGIDTVAGATVSSNGIVTAVNTVVAEVPAVEEPAVEEPAVEEPAVEEPAAEMKTGHAVASAQGFAGPVAVDVTIENNAITALVIGDEQFAETQGFGAKAKEEAFVNQFIGKTLPIEKADIDAIAGATITTEAVISALNKAYEKIEAAAEEPAVEEPAVEEPAAEEVAGTEVEGTAQGLIDPVAVIVTVAEDGTIAKVVVQDSTSATDAAFVHKCQGDEAFLNQFVGKTAPVAEADIDVIVGATVSSKAIVAAVNNAVASIAPAAEEPAVEEPAAEEPAVEEPAAEEPKAEEPAAEEAPAVEAPAAPAAEKVTSAKAAAETLGKFYARHTVQGFAGPVTVLVNVDENGKICMIEIGSEDFAETEGFGAKALEDAFVNQFIGKHCPVQASDIDAIAGATVTTNAVLEALNAAYDLVK